MRTDTPLNLLIVGAGMYACGAGTNGFGTILPAAYEGYKKGLVNNITIVGTNPHKRDIILEKAYLLSRMMGLDVKVAYFPQGNEIHRHAYKKLATTGDYDCTIVAVPDHLHFEVTKDLMANQLHCLVVKPLVTYLSQVDKLIALQLENKVYCAVEFHKRFDETNLHIRRLIRESNIGDILYVIVEYSQRKSIPLSYFKAWSPKTNIFQYLGVHYVDLIYYCTGAFPERVMAIGQKYFLRDKGIDTYDAIQVIIEWVYIDSTKKFTSTIFTNWIDPYITTAMSDQKIKYIGALGRIECDQKDRGLKLVSDQQGIEDINPYFSNFRYNIQDTALNFRGYGYESIIQFLKDCYSLKNGTQRLENLGGLRATFQEAKVSTAVIEAVNDSLKRNGEWVQVDIDSLLT
ncbi:Gfo/Idh/MocA family oxidoreductase [bacterium]|nr:Gfo/Idh/MocA family oxidoreductase [bacterium]